MDGLEGLGSARSHGSQATADSPARRVGVSSGGGGVAPHPARTPSPLRNTGASPSEGGASPAAEWPRQQQLQQQQQGHQAHMQVDDSSSLTERVTRFGRRRTTSDGGAQSPPLTATRIQATGEAASSNGAHDTGRENERATTDSGAASARRPDADVDAPDADQQHSEGELQPATQTPAVLSEDAEAGSAHQGPELDEDGQAEMEDDEEEEAEEVYEEVYEEDFAEPSPPSSEGSAASAALAALRPPGTGLSALGSAGSLSGRQSAGQREVGRPPSPSHRHHTGSTPTSTVQRHDPGTDQGPGSPFAAVGSTSGGAASRYAAAFNTADLSGDVLLGLSGLGGGATDTGSRGDASTGDASYASSAAAGTDADGSERDGSRPAAAGARGSSRLGRQHPHRPSGAGGGPGGGRRELQRQDSDTDPNMNSRMMDSGLPEALLDLLATGSGGVLLAGAGSGSGGGTGSGRASGQRRGEGTLGGAASAAAVLAAGGAPEDGADAGDSGSLERVGELVVRTSPPSSGSQSEVSGEADEGPPPPVCRRPRGSQGSRRTPGSSEDGGGGDHGSSQGQGAGYNDSYGEQEVEEDDMGTGGLPSVGFGIALDEAGVPYVVPLPYSLDLEDVLLRSSSPQPPPGAAAAAAAASSSDPLFRSPAAMAAAAAAVLSGSSGSIPVAAMSGGGGRGGSGEGLVFVMEDPLEALLFGNSAASSGGYSGLLGRRTPAVTITEINTSSDDSGDGGGDGDGDDGLSSKGNGDGAAHTAQPEASGSQPASAPSPASSGEVSEERSATAGGGAYVGAGTAAPGAAPAASNPSFRRWTADRHPAATAAAAAFPGTAAPDSSVTLAPHHASTVAAAGGETGSAVAGAQPTAPASSTTGSIFAPRAEVHVADAGAGQGAGPSPLGLQAGRLPALKGRLPPISPADSAGLGSTSIPSVDGAGLSIATSMHHAPASAADMVARRSSSAPAPSPTAAAESEAAEVEASGSRAPTRRTLFSEGEARAAPSAAAQSETPARPAAPTGPTPMAAFAGAAATDPAAAAVVTQPTAARASAPLVYTAAPAPRQVTPAGAAAQPLADAPAVAAAATGAHPAANTSPLPGSSAPPMSTWTGHGAAAAAALPDNSTRPQPHLPATEQAAASRPARYVPAPVYPASFAMPATATSLAAPLPGLAPTVPAASGTGMPGLHQHPASAAQVPSSWAHMPYTAAAAAGAHHAPRASAGVSEGLMVRPLATSGGSSDGLSRGLYGAGAGTYGSGTSRAAGGAVVLQEEAGDDVIVAMLKRKMDACMDKLRCAAGLHMLGMIVCWEVGSSCRRWVFLLTRVAAWMSRAMESAHLVRLCTLGGTKMAWSFACVVRRSLERNLKSPPPRV